MIVPQLRLGHSLIAFRLFGGEMGRRERLATGPAKPSPFQLREGGVVVLHLTEQGHGGGQLPFGGLPRGGRFGRPLLRGVLLRPQLLALRLDGLFLFGGRFLGRQGLSQSLALRVQALQQGQILCNRRRLIAP